MVWDLGWNEADALAAEEPLERARTLGRAALAAMAQREVAPTPPNYLVWYHHCAGRHPELSAAVRRIEAAGERFTPARCAELYQHFFGTSRQVRLIDETCQRIEATMARLLEEVGGMSADAGAYGARLERFGQHLGTRPGLEDLRALVGELLEGTRAMQARARRLETQLAASSAQMTGLRADLATARREANTDGLTRLANRKCFDRELRFAAEQAAASRRPLCLLLADIDHFKAFNDSHGHLVGDQVLRLIAQVLTGCVKGRDLAARFGGEEFALILPQTGRAGARQLAEQIRHTVASQRIRLKASGRPLGRVTLSLGAAQYRPGEPLEALIRRADAALYQAKRAGRNRVILAPDDAAPDDIAPDAVVPDPPAPLSGSSDANGEANGSISMEELPPTLSTPADETGAQRPTRPDPAKPLAAGA